MILPKQDRKYARTLGIEEDSQEPRLLHGVAWFLSLLAVSASLFSFALQSNILASLFIYLFFWHFILLIDFPFVYPYVNLALNFQLN